jgi:hypothetical protein
VAGNAMDFLTDAHIPESQCAVSPRRDDGTTVGRKGGGSDPIFVSLEGEQAFRAGCVL